MIGQRARSLLGCSPDPAVARGHFFFVPVAVPIPFSLSPESDLIKDSSEVDSATHELILLGEAPYPFELEEGKEKICVRSGTKRRN